MHERDDALRDQAPSSQSRRSARFSTFSTPRAKPKVPDAILCLATSALVGCAVGSFRPLLHLLEGTLAGWKG
jgi:hypothetical protein